MTGSLGTDDSVRSASERPSSSSPLRMSERERERLFSTSRFRLRLTALSLGLVLSLTGLYFALVSEALEALTPTIRADLVSKTESGVQELRHSADLATFVGDAEAIAKASHRYASDPDVQLLRFVDASGRTIFSHGSDEGLSLRTHPPDELVELPSAFARWSTISAEGLPAGSVELVVSKRRLRAGSELYDRLLRVGLLGSVIALFAALAFVNLYVVPILNVAQRTLEKLRQTTRAALVSVETKSRFLANMSHEIRTPMNGVLGMTQLLLRTPLGERQARNVRAIDTAARSLLRIVNDILDFSKIEANRYDLVPSRTSLHEVFGVTVELLEPTAYDKGLELRLALSPDLPEWGLVDGGRLQQVLFNLVGNAIKFTDCGWVRVEAKASDVTPESFRLHVAVEDTGIGISLEDQDRLFEAFTQADNRANRRHEGTGLGLAIARKLVELMQGQLWVEGRDGPGSMFRLTVPVQRPAPSVDQSEPMTAGPRRRSLGRLPDARRPLLVVDDNELNQLVLVEMLEHLGLEAHVASGGDLAVQLARERKYAMILMDCQMPGVDGYAATSQLRELEPPGARTPIVACTAHALAEERARVTAAGMDDLLTKPVELEELRAMLRKWLAEEVVPPSSGERPSEPAPPASAPARGGVYADTPELLHKQRSPEFVRLFLELVPRDHEELRKAAESGDSTELSRMAHKLKGGASSCGAARMARLCAELEDTASLSNPEVQSLLAALEKSVDHVLARLAASNQSRASEREETGKGAPS